jgi:hypothetical protein
MASSVRHRVGITAALLVGLVLACGIHKDEFDCESAVAHLDECCPGFDGRNVDCTYIPAKACGYPILPEIDEPQAACIRGESCSELVSSGVCDRAKQMPVGAMWAGTSLDGGSTPPMVCP